MQLPKQRNFLQAQLDRIEHERRSERTLMQERKPQNELVDDLAEAIAKTLVSVGRVRRTGFSAIADASRNPTKTNSLDLEEQLAKLAVALEALYDSGAISRTTIALLAKLQQDREAHEADQAQTAQGQQPESEPVR